MVKRNRAPPPMARGSTRRHAAGNSSNSSSSKKSKSNDAVTHTARGKAAVSSSLRHASRRDTNTTTRATPRPQPSRDGRQGRRRGTTRAALSPQQSQQSRALIPPELDEDIDDDLAFNSDDEAMYGHLFAQKRSRVDDDNDNDEDDDVTRSLAAVRRSEQRTRKHAAGTTASSKSKGKSGRSARTTKGDDDDDDEALYNYHEEGQTTDEDDDGSDYIDLSDMLDRNLAAAAAAGGDDDNSDVEDEQATRTTTAASTQQTRRAQRDKRVAGTSSSSAPAAGAATVVSEDGRRLTKKRRAAAVTQEAESLYDVSAVADDALPRSYSAALRAMMRADDASGGRRGSGGATSSSTRRADGDGDTSDAASGDDEYATPATASHTRLRAALSNKHMLLSVDEDESTKRRLTRHAVRAAVDEDLVKYTHVLRELNNAPHVQLPFAAPQSSPTVQSLGGIVASAEARLLTTARGNNNNKNNNTSSTDDHATKDSKAGGSAQDAHDDDDAAHRLAQRTHALLSRAGLAPPSRDGDKDITTAAGALAEHIAFDSQGDGHHHSQEEAVVPTAGYMAKLKAMLSYENERRRRFNRIKSKTYRRILRKEHEHERERRQKAFELLHPELARRRLAAQLLRARAEERVTQRHKNSSAWVKHVKRFAGHDAQAKEALQEQLATHQRLMARMDSAAGEEMYTEYVTRRGGDDDDDDASATDERVVDELIESVKQQPQPQASSMHNNNNDARAHEAALLARVLGGDASSTGDAAVGATPTDKARAELLQMRFMKAARERESAGYAEQLHALQEDIRRVQRGEEVVRGADDDNDDDDTATRQPTTTATATTAAQHVGAATRVAAGRWSSAPSMSAAADTAAGRRVRDHSDAVDAAAHVTETSVRVHTPGGIRADVRTRTSRGSHDGAATSSTAAAATTTRGVACGDDGADTRETTATSPPSQFAGDRAPTRSRRVRVLPQTTTSTSSTTTTSTADAADGTATRHTSRTAKALTEETGVTVAHRSSHTRSGGGEKKKEEKAQDKEEDKAQDEEEKAQAYLIARAFAHDDVDADFVREKASQVDGVLKPRDANATLPGWGEWGGADERLNARHRARLRHDETQRAIARSFLLKSRADAHLDHVIINHDGVELVPDRMTLHMIPRPFANAQEFARSLRQPTGPEWTSALSFKAMVQPRVEVRQGQSVTPLDLSLRRAVRTTSRRKRDLTAATRAPSSR